MKTLILLLLAVGAPLSAQAQGSSHTPVEGVVVAAAAASAVQGSAGTTTSRPAMAGAIENAHIGNKVLLRLESARGLRALDRAEFFSAKCGCYRAGSAAGPNYDASAPGPGPGQAVDSNYMQTVLRGEFALTGRAAVLGELPLRQFSPQAFIGTPYEGASGLSDVRVGAKLDLSHDSNSQMTLELVASAPTGDESKGLGTGHWTVWPTVLYNTRIGERLTVETHFGSVVPLKGSRGVVGSSPYFSGRMMTFGLAPTFDAYTRGDLHVAPLVEVVGWRIIDGYSTYDKAVANGTTIVNLNIGARVVRGIHSVYVGYAKALTDKTWFDNAVRIELRRGF